MTPKMINAAASSSSKSTQGYNASQRQRAYRPTAKAIDFALLGRAPGRLTGAGRRLTSHDLEIVEATSELLEADIPEPEGVAADVSLLRGFNATIPSSQRGKTRRRKTRNVDTPHLGLKRLGMNARGLLNDSNYDSAGPEDSSAQVPKGRPRRGRESLAATVRLGREELERQAQEILLDKENLRVRRVRGARPALLYQGCEG
jgi:mitochondrial division protein 1